MARKKLYYLPGDKVSGIATSQKWMLEDGVEYIGPYHTYKSTDEVYTETEYLNGISKPLIPYKNLNNGNEKIIFDYNELTKNKFKEGYKTPIPFRPIPTENDYRRGYMERYVVTQFNYPNIYEVSKTNFDELSDFLYIKKEFKWKVAELKYTDIKEIINTNQKIINLLNVHIPNIERYYTNLAEFSK